MARICRFYSHFGRFSSKKPVVDVIHVGKSHFKEAIDFMKANFLDDPFIRALGISVRHKETQHFLSKLWLTLLRSDLSLAAVHRQKICGLCINSLQMHQGIINPTNFNDNNTTYLQLAQLAKTEGTSNLLHAWDRIEREVPFPSMSKIENDRNIKILEIAACTVGYNHRRLGIAKKIIQSSADMAMLLGFDYVRIDCTHMATAKICNQLGWQMIWEMPFKMFDGVIENSYALADKENSTVQVYIKKL